MDSSKTRKFDHFDNSNTMFGSPLSLVTTEQFPYLLEWAPQAVHVWAVLSGWLLNLFVFLLYLAPACFLVKVSISSSFRNKLENLCRKYRRILEWK